MADSHEYLESLDGFPGCEDVDCLLRIATYPKCRRWIGFVLYETIFPQMLFKFVILIIWKYPDLSLIIAIALISAIMTRLDN